MRRTAVLVCPGRGTYNSAELGWLARYHAPRAALVARFDAERRAAGQAALSELDGAARFDADLHTRGDNASALIFAASYLDALALSEDVELVAVTGNSMGWYTALACAGGVAPEAGFRIANTMGSLMHAHMIGGQLIQPFVDADWREIPGRRAGLLALAAEIGARPGHALALSIDLGGMLVLAGNEAGLSAFEAEVPRGEDGRFPMRLPNHAAFHTALQAPVAAEAQGMLGADLFGQPRLPLIDGRGAIWWPHAVDPVALRGYTLGVQVTEPYDFTRAVTVAAREFAPDLFIVTGPGTTLGGATAQALIRARWRGLSGKADFAARQETAPILVAMGMQGQRRLVAHG